SVLPPSGNRRTRKILSPISWRQDVPEHSVILNGRSLAHTSVLLPVALRKATEGQLATFTRQSVRRIFTTCDGRRRLKSLLPCKTERDGWMTTERDAAHTAADATLPNERSDAARSNPQSEAWRSRVSYEALSTARDFGALDNGLI